MSKVIHLMIFPSLDLSIISIRQIHQQKRDAMEALHVRNLISKSQWRTIFRENRLTTIIRMPLTRLTITPMEIYRRLTANCQIIQKLIYLMMMTMLVKQIRYWIHQWNPITTSKRFKKPKTLRSMRINVSIFKWEFDAYMIDGFSLTFKITASQSEVSQYLNTEEMTSPKHKSQATSPNLPLNDLTINEEEV